MVVVVRRGPPARRVVYAPPPRRGVGAGIVAGAVIGGAVASKKQQKAMEQQAMQQKQIDEANAHAAEAAAAAEEARREAEDAKTAAAASTVTVSVVVPAGVQPGSAFNITFQGQNYTITCPAGVQPGQSLQVNVPAPSIEAQAVVSQPVAAEAEIVSAPPAPIVEPSSSADDLVLVADHKVDENSPSMKQFGIISLEKGDVVTLEEGDLENGLGGSFKDYIKVVVPAQGGRRGMISRLVVKRARETSAADDLAPPPAISF